jgi:hypothetical protein
MTMAVLRLVVAICYGAAMALTLISLVGIFIVDRGHWTVIAGWAFSVALLFAVGRLADLARHRH